MATSRCASARTTATGDQAIEEANGSFGVLGRTDDMLKVSGQWVRPEVESVVAAADGVRECAVVERYGPGSA